MDLEKNPSDFYYPFSPPTPPLPRKKTTTQPPELLQRADSLCVCSKPCWGRLRSSDLGTEQGTCLSTVLFNVSLPVDSDFFQYVIQATSHGDIKFFQLGPSKLLVQYLHILEQE